MTTEAAGRIRDLVVVLQTGHEGRGGEVPCWRAPCLLLPVIVLALKQEAVLRRRHELLRLTQGVGVVGFRGPVKATRALW
jgi:hypothetical protein